MNGRIIVAKPLYVALAQRKEDRKAQLTAQYMQRVSGMRMQQMGQVPICDFIFLKSLGIVLQKFRNTFIKITLNDVSVFHLILNDYNFKTCICMSEKLAKN